MKLLLTRDTFEPDTTTGVLTINDAFECYVLEDTDRKLEDGGIKIPKVTAIPRGTYKVIIDFSNRFQRLMPHILDVPRFEGVRIHSGNTSVDTEGCLLVGRTRSKNFIGESVAAYDALFLKLQTAQDKNEDMTIRIV